MTIRRFAIIGSIGTAALVAACGGEKAPAKDTTAAAAPAAAPAGGGMGETLTPDAGGKVIVVTATTDEQGTNKFDPAELHANRGDVIRYTLKTGVHNVDFLPDSNPGKSGLPPASQLLQLPGQTFDVKVGFAPGTYYFQCDPHAALGMKGHLTVDK